MGHLTDRPGEVRHLREHDPGALLIALGTSPGVPAAELRIDVADPALRARIEAKLRAALAPAEARPACPPLWKLSTAGRARKLGARLQGALVVVRGAEARPGRLRRLVALVEALGAAGIQVVCPAAMREPLERAVFRLLEERRGQAGRPPLVLATTEHPVEVLLRSIAGG